MPSETVAHPVYAGTYRHSLDAKHRFAVPARWRSHQEDAFYVMPAATGDFLFASPPDEFEKMYATIQTDSRIQAEDRRKFVRHFFSKAVHSVTDRQGRLLLPDEFCRVAGLATELVLTGSYDRFEIWNPNRWTAAQEAESGTFQDISKAIGL